MEHGPTAIHAKDIIIMLYAVITSNWVKVEQFKYKW
jgi:hypothetical protein